MKLSAFVLLCAFAGGQNPGFRLGYVRSIYIEDLGSTEAAKMVRDQLIGFIMGHSSLGIETDKTRTHAILTGTAIVTSGETHWAVASSSSSSGAAAVSTPQGNAAAAASSARSSSSIGGGTIRITELGLQLSDEYGKLLWAFDASNCSDVAARLATRSRVNKPVIGCAVEQMIKAINKDAKKARR